MTLRFLQTALLVVVLAVSTQAVAAQETELRIQVAHPLADDAEVRVGLYTDRSNWLDEEPIVGGLAVATDSLTTVIFTGLPTGVYGAAVYLDENRNGKLDRNLVGWFKEPFGFSRDARVRMGPPKWNDATFEVSEEPVQLFIRLD